VSRLIIRRPVQIRARVTPTLKKTLAAEIQDALKRVELELQQLDFQARRLTPEFERSSPQQAQTLRAHLETERQKRQEKKAALLERLKEVARLEEGTEIVQGNVEGTVEVGVGDRWEEVMSAAIVLEDGVVVEIRDGRG